METQELVEKIKQANRDYYLQGVANISDAEYDAMVQELRELDPQNPVLLKVGDNSEAENKVKLPNIMGSLNKTRPDEGDIEKLYSSYDLVMMPKLDGISMQIEYHDGKFYKLYTRGNGFEGQDITARGQYMNFPKTLEKYKPGTITYIFGEAVVSRANFKKAKGEYKHPRNFVGGTLRPILTNKEYDQLDDDIKFNCSLIDIVVFNGIIPGLKNKTFNGKMTFIEETLKFKTANHEVYQASTVDTQVMEEKLDYYMTKYDYLTDGIVLRINDEQTFDNLGLEANGLNPKGARAVKPNLEKQFSQIGEIKEVEWNISKRGLFIPTIVLKNPIYFDGVEVTRISGCNAKYVEENSWVEGAKVKVIRSGGVIPRIIATKSDTPATLPTTCPYCGTKLEYDTHIYCPNANCSGRRRSMVIEFFNALALPDVSYETVAGLYDKGFDTLEKLLSITYKDLIQLEGYQASKAVTVERELTHALQDITLTKLMYISQMFSTEKTSLGETKLSWIVDAYGEDKMLASLNNEANPDGSLKKLDPNVLLEIKGLGQSGIEIFTSNYIAFKSLYMRLKPFIKLKENILITGALTGMIFTFTQFRDKELEDLITQNGGQVKGISKKTTALFAAGESTKLAKAQEYGIPIIRADQAKEYLMNLLKGQANG